MTSKCKVLLVDDDKNIRRSLQVALQNHDFDVHLAQDGQQALQVMQVSSFDVIVVDVVLGDFSGIDLFSRIRQKFLDIPVIFMSGMASLTEVAKLMKLGAADFLEKPFSPDRLILSIQKSFEFSRLQERVRYLEGIDGQNDSDQIYGESVQIRRVRELIGRVSSSNAAVLITGESGTGKELVAKQIHSQSKRSHEAFIKINCSAIPESLLESELFGHEKGAFTGAIRKKKGYFELANHGTIFLDEIGDMSLGAQAKILRVLQNGDIQAVGAEQSRQVDVRIIAATHKDMALAVKDGTFREDLYFRLNVVPIYLPPLRERAIDIPFLAQKIIQDIAVQSNYERRHFESDALDALSRLPWPGNIRELRNFIERLLIIGGGPIHAEELESPLFANKPNELSIDTLLKSEGSASSLKKFRDSAERYFIVHILRSFGGNISRAAAHLEIERTYLHRRLAYFGIEKKEYL